jgi:hypothetical protein
MVQGRVVVNRTSDRDIKARDLIVRVDEDKEDNLKYQQSMEVDLDPGEHTVHVTNNLIKKSATFTIKGGETVTFQAGNVAGGCIGPFVVLIGIYSVMLERVE